MVLSVGAKVAAGLILTIIVLVLVVGPTAIYSWLFGGASAAPAPAPTPPPSPAGGPCGGVTCVAPTPACLAGRCVGCATDLDCPRDGPRVVHGYSLAGAAAPTATLAAESPAACLQAAGSGAAVAEYSKNTKQCSVFATIDGLAARAPADDSRVIFEIGAALPRK